MKANFIGFICIILCCFHIFSCENKQSSNSDDNQPSQQPEVMFIQISPSQVELQPGDTIRLEAIPYDSNNSVIEDINILWKSNDTNIAVIDENGLVKAINPGTAKITAAYQSFTSYRVTANIYRSIFYSSFESAKDTIGWYGFSDFNYSQEVPVGGGTRSLHVSGGCLIPHFAYDLEPVHGNSTYVLRVWGKLVEKGGTVSLYYK